MDAIRYWQRSAYASDFAKNFESLVANILRGKMTLQEYFANRLDTCDTIFVKSHIITRLRHLAETHDEVAEPLLPQDLPSDGGYVWLETPIHIHDARGKQVSIKVIFWHKEYNGVMVAYMSDANDLEDFYSREAIEMTKDITPIQAGSRTPLLHVTSWAWGDDIRRMTLDKFTAPPLLEEDPELAETYRESLDIAAQDMITIFKFVLALWEFMGDQIPMVAHPDRPLRRRLMREKSKLSEVLVVDLRPVKNVGPHYEDPQLVMWSHRWRVRPHKRRWIDKEGNYRETTVSGYVKGPDHLPLIEKDRVFNVRR